MPPAGISLSTLYAAIDDALGEDQAKAFWRWSTVDEPTWGREGWQRLDKARKACPTGVSGPTP